MKKLLKVTCFAVFAFLLSFTESFAENTAENEYNSRRGAICTISSSGEEYVVDDCIVTYGVSDEYGWIFLERKDAKPLLEEILLISVYETAPDKAQVSGVTQNGNNSRWGEATKQNDCYAGSDFRICIKAKQ